MSDEELTRRLSETLRAKAAEVPEPTGAFDATAEVTEVAQGPKPARGVWRYALAAAALVALVVGVTAVVLGTRSDDHSGTSAPVTSTTTEAPTTVPPSTTTSTRPSPTTTTTVIWGPQPAPSWAERPQLDPNGTVPVAAFNAYLDSSPSTAANPRALALTFTQNDPPPTEPANALRVEEHSLSNGRHQVIVFVLLADDSVAEARYDLVFTPRNDGTWRMASASWSGRCQPNRGHQEFNTEPCI